MKEPVTTSPEVAMTTAVEVKTVAVVEWPVGGAHFSVHGLTVRSV
jgi:hypothetical protein